MVKKLRSGLACWARRPAWITSRASFRDRRPLGILTNGHDHDHDHVSDPHHHLALHCIVWPTSKSGTSSSQLRTLRATPRTPLSSPAQLRAFVCSTRTRHHPRTKEGPSRRCDPPTWRPGFPLYSLPDRHFSPIANTVLRSDIAAMMQEASQGVARRRSDPIKKRRREDGDLMGTIATRRQS